jgi:hypothetical protein
MRIARCSIRKPPRWSGQIEQIIFWADTLRNRVKNLLIKNRLIEECLASLSSCAGIDAGTSPRFHLRRVATGERLEPTGKPAQWISRTRNPGPASAR